ncbi:hypothetical protein AAY473_040041, partial [Plecturocebus cupreus]
MNCSSGHTDIHHCHSDGFLRRHKREAPCDNVSGTMLRPLLPGCPQDNLHRKGFTEGGPEGRNLRRKKYQRKSMEYQTRVSVDTVHINLATVQHRTYGKDICHSNAGLSGQVIHFALPPTPDAHGGSPQDSLRKTGFAKGEPGGRNLMWSEHRGISTESQSQISTNYVQVSLPNSHALVISRTPLPVFTWAALSPKGPCGGQQNLAASGVAWGHLASRQSFPQRLELVFVKACV